MKTISWAITVCNELEELNLLLAQIFNIIKDEDEVIILFDTDKGSKEVENYLEILNKVYNQDLNKSNIKPINFKYFKFSLNKDFASFKNYLGNQCVKDYVFFIDADELLNETLALNIHNVLENNDIDVYLVPRENYVDGITEEDINKWGWNIDSKNRINYPDLQMRIVRNAPQISWQNKVHETIIGHKTLSMLPIDIDGYSLIHRKSIEKQRKQNEFYSKIKNM